jgi:arginyl-tRNA synthetase
VLGNLYEAVGYYVHRVNYLNDWGGMGFLLEGLSRRSGDAEKFENKNDFLFEIYSTFRKGQKFSASAEEFAKASEKDLSDLVPIFGNHTDVTTLKTAFDDFKTKSDSRFSALEGGDSAEFANWRKIVEWSLADFERFYAILDVHQDYFVGESLYSGLGKTLIREAVTT